MMVLMIVLVYFLGSLIATRSTFVRSLGAQSRYKVEQRYTNVYDSRDFSKVNVVTRNETYGSAVGLAVLIGVFWPIAFPFYLTLTAPTPHEKDREKEAKQRQLEIRFKELEQEVLKFGERL